MLRVLTNMRLYTLAGIAQYVSGFVAHNEIHKNFMLYGVDVLRPDEPTDTLWRKRKSRHFHMLRSVVDYPDLGEVNRASHGDLAAFRESFKDVIAAYAKAINRVKPDIILINGSYFLPWCLLQAACDYGKASVCIHYHGILKKEVAHWTNTIDRSLMLKMEQGFDVREAFYIFPSQLAKRTVEREVFGHAISRCAVLPNPVAPEFASPKHRRRSKSIGIVGRWTKIKNIDFIIRLARHNARSRLPLVINVISDLKSPKDTRQFKGLMRFSKPMVNRKLASFYGRQGVIISPSTFETYGNVAQEALASGTPAFVNARMGIAETFRKLGLNDWVVDFTSPASVLKMARMAASARVPEQAIATLRDAYSPATIFTKYSKILSSAV